MQERVSYPGASKCGFFLTQLRNLAGSIDQLMQEAYILVKHLGLSYSDIKLMTLFERRSFLQIWSDEQERIKNETQ